VINTTIVLFDLETTGFLNDYSTNPDDQPGIVQIGAVKVDMELNEVGRFMTFVDPELKDPAKWTADAQASNGIKPEDVANAPNYYAVHTDWAEFCRGAKYLGGFNILPFDVPVLQWTLLRYGLATSFPWPPVQIDVMPMASRYMNMKGKAGRKNPKLGEIYEDIMGKPLDGAHDALVDIFGTLEVLKGMGGLKQFGFRV